MSDVHRPFREERSNYLRHFPSTPHLFLESSAMRGSSHHHRSFNNVLTSATISTTSSNPMANSYIPKTGFSTFKKPKPKPPPKSSSISNLSRYQQDDLNPYKVSSIEQYNRIKVNDPFLPKKSSASAMISHSSGGSSSSRGSQSQIFSFEDHDQRETLDQLELNKRAQNLYEEQCRSMTIGYNNVHNQSRSATVKCRGRSSSSNHALNTSTGKASNLERKLIIPEPDYEPENEPYNHPIYRRRDNNKCRESDRLEVNRPVLDSSSSSSEGYSSVRAGTSPSSSCFASASDPDPDPEPDTYAVPMPMPVPSPDEGLILEGSDDNAEKSSTARISAKDRIKIEYALTGRKTSIFVADCLANLYCMRKSNFLATGGYSCEGEWELKYTGVPVLLLDLGETRSRDKRRIQIVLAELGTGLALWKDVIDNLSSYKVMEGSHAFHSMHLSTDHTTIIGLSFDDEECAEQFSKWVDSLTSDFANISLSGAKNRLKSKKSNSKSREKYAKLKKSEISQPCSFSHISTLSMNDKRRFPSLQNFVVHAAATLKSLDQAKVSATDFVSLSSLAQGSELHF